MPSRTSASASKVSSSVLSRASTGITGLDVILGGGFPRSRLYMIEGAGGTGKTTLGLQFCFAGVREGERAMYLSLSETEAELRQVIDSHGWSADGLDIISFSDHEEEDSTEEYTLFHPSEVELGQTTQRVLEAIEKHRPERVVLDTLSGLRLMADDPLRYRRQIESLRSFLTSRGCTVLVVDEIDQDRNYSFQPRSLSHGVITLESHAPDYGPERRRLQVRKMRGIPYESGYHDLRIDRGGLQVYPRLVAAKYVTREFTRELVSSGLPQVDSMLGGGLVRGGSTLVMGAAGTGKSSLTLNYCIAAAKRGEKCAYFIFDESSTTFFDRARSLGMDPQPLVDQGLLVVQQIDPAEMSPGEFAHNLREMVEKGGMRMVVIDSLSGYLYAMPNERFLSLHMHELLTYLGAQGITVLLTLVQHGLVGEAVETPAELSFLADSVILLRYFEAKGEIRKAISVFKKRSGYHEPTIREYLMQDGTGIVVGKPLRDFQGVLTGIPHFIGEGVEADMLLE